jgi:PAS domain S-box-containing protein
MAIRNGRILFTNPAGSRMLGFSDPDKMVDMPAIDVVAPESLQMVRKRIERLESEKDNPTAEIALIRQDGIRITTESTSVSIRIDGIPTAVIIAQDISVRKEKEEKLQMMQFSIDHALDRIAWIAPDGRFLYANEAACKEMDYALDEVLSMSVSDIDPNFPIEKWNEHYREVKKKGSMRIETQQISGDGQTHDIEVSTNCLKFGDREFMCSFGRDITERKQLELKLIESEERFRAFMDNIPAVAYIKDESGRHVYGNKSLFDSFETSPDKFIGTTTKDFFPADIARRIEAYDSEVLSDGVIIELDDYWEEIGGQRRWWKVLKFPIILHPEDRLIGGIAFDISERKFAEQTVSEQLEFERQIADISANLAQTEPDQLGETIDSTLRSLVRILHTERAFVAQFSKDDSRLKLTNTWAAEGISASSSIFEIDLATEVPWVAQHILNGRVISAGPGLTGLPDEANELRDWLERDGINSGVVVPVRVEGRSIGMLGLDTLDQPREYPQSIVDRLRIVADMIGSTLRRVQAQKKLQKSLNEVKQLKGRIELENIYLREEIAVKHKHEEIIGESEAIQKVLSQAEQVAEADTTVLVLGETGTGKELLARAIHNISARKARPMIKVNCAALPPTLIETELFGREKGAYTGALTKQKGRFELADGSTIFLDEISELPLELQPKLLRVLQEGRFERVGSSKTITVNARIIAATNQDLSQAVRSGRFREDLFYRLNVFPITVPPLRERQEDIPMLVWAFVKEFEETMAKRIKSIPRKSMEALQHYPWPGNVRELRNVIEQAMIITKDEVLNIRVPTLSDLATEPEIKLVDVERNHILKILQKTGWRIKGRNGAAELLGLHPATLYSKMKRLGIERPMLEK